MHWLRTLLVSCAFLPTLAFGQTAPPVFAVNLPLLAGASAASQVAPPVYIVNLPALGAGHDAQTAVAGAATSTAANVVVTSEGLTTATAYTLTLTDAFVATTSVIQVTPADGAATGVQIKSVTPSTGSVVIVVGMASLTGTVKLNISIFN